MIQLRAFQAADTADLPKFLALAAHEDDAQIALANPDLARYIESWALAKSTAAKASIGRAGHRSTGLRRWVKMFAL